MDEKTLINDISALVEEEHELRAALQAGRISAEEEHERLRQVEEQLDQCWDLLRRRRAARNQGGSPDEVATRPVDEVEHYLQ